MTLPTFFTVGAEKCGTTALHIHLTHHPQIFMSEPKEPSFFVSTDQRYLEQDMGELEGNYISSLSEYQAIFSNVTNEIAIGESSPCYLYSDVAPSMISELVPEAKIIIILRNPMERAYSQFVFNQMRGWEPMEMTFNQALGLEDERFLKNSMWAFHYTRRGMYSSQVALYQQVFGSKQIHVTLYDDFVKHPELVLENIYQFLGVHNFKLEDVGKRHNVTGLAKSKRLNQLISSPNPLKSALKRLIPQSVRKRIMGKIKTMNTSKPEADTSELLELEKVFTSDIHKLSRIIQPDPLIWLNNYE